MIATDQDVDGDHIAGLFTMALFLTWPTLFYEHVIYKSSMPLIIATHGKNDVKFFSNAQEIEDLMTSAERKKYNIRFIKGLGQYSKRFQIAMLRDKQFETIITADSITTAQTYIKHFDEDHASTRREILTQACVEHRISFYDTPSVLIDKYLDKNLISFFQKNISRHIPSLFDGLNDSQRRVLFTVYNEPHKNYKFSNTCW